MIGEIPLTRGRAALVDAEDYDFLMQWKWCVITGYAVRTTTRAGGAKPKTILMHRVIVAPPEGFFVDHINCNRLDNRRANLRICTPEENTLNRSPRIRKAERASQFKGVCWSKRHGKWAATISRASAIGKRHAIFLGHFEHEIDAALAYDAAALRLFGEFAYLNFSKL